MAPIKNRRLIFSQYLTEGGDNSHTRLDTMLAEFAAPQDSLFLERLSSLTTPRPSIRIPYHSMVATSSSSSYFLSIPTCVDG